MRGAFGPVLDVRAILGGVEASDGACFGGPADQGDLFEDGFAAQAGYYGVDACVGLLCVSRRDRGMCW